MISDLLPDPAYPIDAGIREIVYTLVRGGVETYESCEGGEGHAFPEPTVRFHGGASEGFKALAVAIQENLPVEELRRVWPVIDGEPTGPCWEMTFTPSRLLDGVEHSEFPKVEGGAA